MARKMNAFKLASETRGPTQVSDRQPMPPAAALCVESLRPHPCKVPPPVARQQIAIHIEEPSPAPCVVKIIHSDLI